MDLLPSEFWFSNVTEAFVLKLLKNMNIDKAAGIDNLFKKFLKYEANILAKPISKTCNLSIKYSIFPTDCHIAKLKPLLNKGSTTFLRNYRSISLLLLISKIIENVIHYQTQAFLDKNKIIYRFQSDLEKTFLQTHLFHI